MIEYERVPIQMLNDTAKTLRSEDVIKTFLYGLECEATMPQTLLPQQKA